LTAGKVITCGLSQQ